MTWGDRIRLLLLFALVVLARPRAGAAAPAPTLSFDHITSEEGLSSNWVQGILKDSRGFVWIGTQDGLVRYDAGSFAIYRHNPKDPRSLPFTTVKEIFEDSRKQLWFGAYRVGGGLAVYDRTTDRFQAFVPDGTPKNPSGPQVRSIVEDNRGHLWFATNRGLNEYDPVAKTFTVRTRDATSDALLATNDFQALAIDTENRIWAGAGTGLTRYNIAKHQFERWGSLDDPLNRANVWDLYSDGRGSVWAATLNAGLHQVNTVTGAVHRYTHDPNEPNSLSTDRLRALASDGRGKLFVGAENGGLNILEISTGHITRHKPDIAEPRSLNSVSIYSLYYDDQDILWVGTFNGGVNVLSPPGQRFATIRARPGGLSDPHVAAILEEDNGTLWIGTDGGGLDRREVNGRWTHYQNDVNDPGSIGSDAILAVAQDRDKTIWVGGWDSGLAYYDRARDRFVGFRHRDDDPESILSDRIFTILPLSTGELLVGTQFGPFLFNRQTKKSTRVDALGRQGATYTSGTCYSVMEDREGDLWFGGDGVVAVWSRRSNTATQYTHDPKDPNSLGTGGARAILGDSRGNVWVGTQDGLNVFAAGTRRLRRITFEDGLPHKVVNGIVEDEAGNLWLATQAGIARFDLAVQLPATPTFMKFDIHDGLQASEFRSATFKSRNGRMYFGGPRGLSSFVPARIGKNVVPPPVVFTGLRLFNQPVPVDEPGSPLRRAIGDTEHLTLSYKQSMVTLEYAALNYLLPQKNQYAYRLEPVDREWTTVGTQRSATYPNLAPGHYTFRVRAWNNDGVPNETGAALSITVTPPFWHTWWFRAVGVIALAGVMADAYRRRMRAMEERRHELEAEVGRRTADLQTEVVEHQRTEQQLQKQMSELERTEAEIARNNRALLENRDALEKENLERRRAEEAAVRERDLMHTLMDNIPDLIYFKDRMSRFTRVNKAHAAMLGVVAAGDAEGKTEADFLPRDFARESLEGEQAIFSTGRPLVGKVEHDSRTGRWFLSTKVPVRTATGDLTGLVGISKDITERRLAEERLAGELAAFREMVDLAAHGDLTRRGVEGEETVGQIARAVNRMLESFSDLLSEVRDAAFSVSSSSSQILAASKEIAKGADLGTHQVGETVTSVEEMAASMSLVSKNAEVSAEKARQVLEHVRSGDRAVEAAHQGMTKIHAAAAETTEKMRTFEQRSHEVFGIIDIIEEIGSQLKLLSLNAAIEAAHAGDAGRGFAVVADEVRRLADRSTEATTEVAGRINAIVEETQAALAAMENAMREVKEGRALSDQARRSFGDISTLVQASAEVSLEIADASQEQVKATERVSQAMSALSLLTMGSAVGAEETRKAVQDLVQLSSQLSELMARFKTAS